MELQTLPKNEIEFGAVSKMIDARLQQDRIFSAERIQREEIKQDGMNSFYYFALALVVSYFVYSFCMSENFIEISKLHKENRKAELIAKKNKIEKEIKDYE